MRTKVQPRYNIASATAKFFTLEPYVRYGRSHERCFQCMEVAWRLNLIKKADI